MMEIQSRRSKCSNRCKCCLESRRLRDLWGVNFRGGEREVYGEMLSECFTIAKPTEGTELICDFCTWRLRDAFKFKQQVLASEQLLLERAEQDDDFESSNSGLQTEEFKRVIVEDVNGSVLGSMQDDSVHEHGEHSGYLGIHDSDTDNQKYLDDDYYEVEYLEDDDIVQQNKERQGAQIGNTTIKMIKRVPKSSGEDAGVGKKKNYRAVTNVQNKLQNLTNRESKISLVPVEKLKYLTKTKTVQTKIDKNKQRDKDETTSVKPISIAPKKEQKAIQKLINTLTEEITSESNNELEERQEESESGGHGTDEEIVEEMELHEEPEAPEETTVLFEKKYSERSQHQDNLTSILLCSNATPFQSYGDGGFECCFCMDQYLNPADLKRHTSLEHDDVKGSYMKDRELSVFRVKIDITSLQCKICDKGIETLEELLEHLQIEHSENVHRNIKNLIVPYKFESDDVFSCFMCKTEFTRFKQLTLHMRVHYRNFECDICGAGYISKRDLRAHGYTHHVGTYPCSKCPEVFQNRLRKGHHEKVAHKVGGKLVIACGLCGERFKYETSKWKHQFEVHGFPIPEFKCKACEKSFSTQKSLTKHTRRVHLSIKRNRVFRF